MSTKALLAVLDAYDRKAQRCPYCHPERDQRGNWSNTHVNRAESHTGDPSSGRILHKPGCLAGLLIPSAEFEQPYDIGETPIGVLVDPEPGT